MVFFIAAVMAAVLAYGLSMKGRSVPTVTSWIGRAQ